MTKQTKFLLNESDMPKQWYNVNADMPVSPSPVLHPRTCHPRFPLGALPHGIDHAGSQRRPLHRHPRRSAGDL